MDRWRASASRAADPIVVEDGYATEITGGPEAAQLVGLLEPHGRDARNVAEFGIGTNDRAKLTG